MEASRSLGLPGKKRDVKSSPALSLARYQTSRILASAPSAAEEVSRCKSVKSSSSLRTVERNAHLWSSLSIVTLTFALLTVT
jgi:hypothetical protein